MRIRLTEAQAWETLARFFGGQRADYRTAEGLCFQLDEFMLSDWISHKRHRVMLHAVERAAYRYGIHGDGFIWTRTRAGCLARARFCWRQVKRLKGW